MFNLLFSLVSYHCYYCLYNLFSSCWFLLMPCSVYIYVSSRYFVLTPRTIFNCSFALFFVYLLFCYFINNSLARIVLISCSLIWFRVKYAQLRKRINRILVQVELFSSYGVEKPRYIYDNNCTKCSLFSLLFVTLNIDWVYELILPFNIVLLDQLDKNVQMPSNARGFIK